MRWGCFRLQRYKLLKAIHNYPNYILKQTQLFQTTKIQTFESNSQQVFDDTAELISCFRLQRYKLSQSNSQRSPSVERCSGCYFRLQRYKLLKAIHNFAKFFDNIRCVVSDYKDTNFWKQFTTPYHWLLYTLCCFRLRKYKLLKAIHNCPSSAKNIQMLFQTIKIQTFSKQFTTLCHRKLKCFCFFR